MTMTWRGEVLERKETISSIRGTAKDDDGGGWPFHETPYFEKLEEAMAWVDQAREKGYAFIRVSVTYDVVEVLTNSTCYSSRYETPYLYNANIAQDAEYYEKLKGYGQLSDGEWVVIRNGKLLSSSEDEKEALRIACRETGRCLVRQAWHETEHDDLGVVEIRKRASLLK